MPLVYPFPFPSEVSKDPVEMFRYARQVFGRDQKWRAGQFSWSSSIPALTIRTVTFTDTSVGGSDTGVDNLLAGMCVIVSPPNGISPAIQLDYAYVPAAGKLTMQVRNTTAAAVNVAGTWQYIGYTF